MATSPVPGRSHHLCPPARVLLAGLLRAPRCLLLGLLWSSCGAAALLPGRLAGLGETLRGQGHEGMRGCRSPDRTRQWEDTRGMCEGLGGCNFGWRKVGWRHQETTHPNVHVANRERLFSSPSLKRAFENPSMDSFMGLISTPLRFWLVKCCSLGRDVAVRHGFQKIDDSKTMVAELAKEEN